MLNDPRPTYLKVHLPAILSNYQYFKQRMHPKTVIPVVKADAYGHGAIEVVGALYDEGVTLFAVSLVEEALELREHFEDIEILLMGPTHPSALSIVSEHNLMVTVYDQGMIEAIKHLNHPLRVHLKVDTGMHRLGFLSDAVLEAYEALKKMPHVTIEGIYTHFAGAEHDDAQYHAQRQMFHHILRQIDCPPSVHAANTEASLNDEQHDPFTTHVRIGLGLYGACQEPHKHPLNPTLTWHTKVASIKTIPKGAKVGYSGTYQANTEETIALLPVGYADGLWRTHQDQVVSINQKTYPIVGRISMDQTTIRVDHTVKENDEVLLLGGHQTSIYDFASRTNTIPYEIFTNLSKRVPRYHIK